MKLSSKGMATRLAAAALLAASPLASAQTTATYDYVVIGSGPGGGVVASNLAKAGYSVFLLEAGDESAGQGFGAYTPTVTWDFWVKHYPEGHQWDNKYSHQTWLTPDGKYWVGESGAPAGSKLLGVYYPRGATLGGSSMINAMCTWLPSESDWNYHANVTGDDSWRAENMHKIFAKIEKNNYLPRGTPNHGFDGFFQTYMGFRGGQAGNKVMQEFAKDFVATGNNMALAQQLTRDSNEITPTRDQTSSVYGLVNHQYSNGQRYSSRDYIQETAKERSNLTISLTSLATKVLFDTSGTKCGAKPRATGVEYLFGKSVYAADNRRTATTRSAAQKRTVLARREVIVSGGAFNSPQILQLSGIGNKQDLEKLGIPSIADLPGVGQNLMDNQEMPIVGTGSTSGFAGVAMFKTKHPAHGERDMFLMGGQGFLFRGFWPNNAMRVPAEPRSPYGVSMVKGSSVNNKGWVKIRSSDPTETPDINFNHFAEGSEDDLEAMKDTVAWIRKVYGRSGITPVEPPCTKGPDANGYCGKEDEDWIHARTFGHHPTSTNKIGGDNDPMAVLDSKFRVRGVTGLRVVDASAFARIPGIFPAVSTFMISQKASDDMLAELKDGTAIPVCAA